MKWLALVLPTLLIVYAPLAAAVELETIAEGLTAPIDLADPDDGSGRLYSSYAALLRDGAPKGWNYTRRISELTLAADADLISLGAERTLIELDWPSRKHNGGGLAFGPDGFLHIGLGDGGGARGVGKEVIWSAFDVPKEQLYWDRLAQDTSSLFGSILRIDVDRGFPGYGIPDSNPFVGKSGRDEIYAFGFRNPYRIAFDALGSGDFLVTAIAETLWESIYLVSSPIISAGRSVRAPTA